MRKKLLFSIGILMLCLVAYALYMYNKPHTSVAAVTPAVTINAADLYTAYSQNEAAANKQYLDKVLLVKGTISDVTHTGNALTIMLESNDITGGVSCNISDAGTAKQSVEKGKPIYIKGRCTGFLADVTLVDCVIEQ